MQMVGLCGIYGKINKKASKFSSKMRSTYKKSIDLIKENPPELATRFMK